MPSTPRMGLPYPVSTDSPAGHSQIQSLAQMLDSNAAMFAHGTESVRPSAGKPGRVFYATDLGHLFYDTGAAWVQVTQGAAQVDGPPTVGTLRTLGTGNQQAASGNDARFFDARTPLDNSVTAAKVHTSLKPSSGAGSATEALRALGTQAGRAAAGIHASQHAQGGADPLPANSVALDMLQKSVILPQLYEQCVPYITNGTAGAWTKMPLASNVSFEDGFPYPTLVKFDWNTSAGFSGINNQNVAFRVSLWNIAGTSFATGFGTTEQLAKTAVQHMFPLASQWYQLHLTGSWRVPAGVPFQIIPEYIIVGAVSNIYVNGHQAGGVPYNSAQIIVTPTI